MAISVYLSQEQIASKVSELATQMNTDYKDESIIVVCVMNGSFIFVSDLVRKMDGDVILDFISCSSYEGTQSTGALTIQKDIRTNIEGKNVILVEDIVDTGLTISKLVEDFKKRSPKSLKVASLLHKSVKTVVPVQIDYLGFEIEDKFVIGYGLDFDDRYRQLPYIGIYEG